MTRKGIVLCAIERAGPPRVPVTYCNRDFDCSDVLSTGYAEARGFVPSEPGMTEWGYAWESLDRTMGQPRSHPLADWDSAAAYVPPDPCAPGRLDHIAAWAAESQDRFLRFGVGISGFNQATFLRGFEAFLMDLCEAPDRAQRVLDIVFGFENALIEQIAGAPVDAVAFADDWGTQNGLMVSLDCWRRVFRPRYADQFARVHCCGKKVWFHTCGNVWAILGDLIECGADVIELLQPDVFGVDRLAAEYGGRVCFCCSVDHQRRAVSGTRDEILAYVRLLHESLGAFDGGFIGYVEDYASLGMDEQHYQWIRQAFHGLEPYGAPAPSTPLGLSRLRPSRDPS